jgi:hypothetical protein
MKVAAAAAAAAESHGDLPEGSTCIASKHRFVQEKYLLP